MCHNLCLAIVAPMDGSSLKELYLAHCKVHKVLDRSEAEECAKLCEVGKAYLIRKAKALVRSAQGRAPLHVWVGCDQRQVRSHIHCASKPRQACT